MPVTGAAVSDVAPWDNDPQLRRTNTTAAIRQCLETLDSGNKLAVCGLRGPKVVVRGFEFPVLPTDEIDGAVELEAAQMCPFSTDDSTLDHQVTTNDNRKTHGFWVAATRSLIDDKRQMMRDAGLKCTLIDVDGLALLNALEGLTPEQTNATDNDKAGDTSHNRSAVLGVGGHLHQHRRRRPRPSPFHPRSVLRRTGHHTPTRSGNKTATGKHPGGPVRGGLRRPTDAVARPGEGLCRPVR